MPQLGVPELIIILVILLLLFGAAKLPKLAKSIGEAGGELRKGFDGGIKNDKEANTKSASKSDKS